MNEMPPSKPSNDGNAPGGPSNSAFSGTRSAKTTFSETATKNSESFISSTGGENALLVTGGKVTLNLTSISVDGSIYADSSSYVIYNNQNITNSNVQI